MTDNPQSPNPEEIKKLADSQKPGQPHLSDRQATRTDRQQQKPDMSAADRSQPHRSDRQATGTDNQAKPPSDVSGRGQPHLSDRQVTRTDNQQKHPPERSASNDKSDRTKYVEMAHQAARDADISEKIFAQQIQVESKFNPRAQSRAGAEGIAQLMPKTAEAMKVNPWNPAEALRGAAHLMKENLLHYHGDYAKALAAYNAGRPRVDQAVARHGEHWLEHLPKETRDYVPAILGK